MRSISLLVSLFSLALAKEIPKDPSRAAELYDSGVMHERILAAKEAEWAKLERMNVLNAAAGPTYPELHFAQC